MTKEEVLSYLSSLKNEKQQKMLEKNGISQMIYGVMMGKVRPLAKQIKIDHKLAIELWNSNIYEAMILATMIMDNRSLTEEDFESLIVNANHANLVDELTFRALAENSFAKKFTEKWSPMEGLYGRAGWNLAISRVMDKTMDKPEMESLLLEIEQSMKQADEDKKWAMNYCLCQIGIHMDEYTDRCLKIGKKLQVYADMKVSKGCTSAYALEWIPVGRAKKTSK